MTPNLLFYQLLVVALVLICFLIHVWWPDHPSGAPQTPCKPNKPRRKRSKEPKPFMGYIHTNRYAKRVSKGSILVPMPPARPLR
jgi:hypothetical protein